MNRTCLFIASGTLAATALCVGYAGVARAAQKATPLAAPAGAIEAFAHVNNAGSVKEKISGTVTFVPAEGGGLKVTADIDGLTPGKHGFHIHEKADLSDPELKGAGGHFNPGGHKHGGPESEEHHAGDLGNLTADEKGHAHLEETFKGLTLEGATGVIGHSVVIHQKEDDLKSDPSGESGKRVAGGVIEAGKHEHGK